MHNCKQIHGLDIFEEVTNAVLNVGAVFVFAIELEPRLVNTRSNFYLFAGGCAAGVGGLKVLVFKAASLRSCLVAF